MGNLSSMCHFCTERPSNYRCPSVDCHYALCHQCFDEFYLKYKRPACPLCRREMPDRDMIMRLKKYGQEMREHNRRLAEEKEQLKRKAKEEAKEEAKRLKEEKKQAKKNEKIMKKKRNKDN